MIYKHIMERLAMYIENCFLGSNSSKGFYSLYDSFCSDKTADTVYILKGGPGCGKSTLMKTVAKAAEEKGYDVERVWCSGDPDSLDAINIVQKKLIIADGTSPHVLEPPLTGIVGKYLDLSRYYDMKNAADVRKNISVLNTKYKNLYARAYDMINAAASVRASEYEVADKTAMEQVIRPMAKELVLNLADGRFGRQRHVFLSALCCRGFVTFFDGVTSGSGRIYRLAISPLAGKIFMKAASDAVKEEGFDSIMVHDPIEPEEISSLIFPDRCVLTIENISGQNSARFKSIDVDFDAGRFSGNENDGASLSSTLFKKAESMLKDAKAIHDDIEALYRPYVNFSAVEYETQKIVESL